MSSSGRTSRPPVLDFNLYLTGYDVQTINLRDLLVSGIVPQRASAGQDPSDTISPKGQFSQDINFASCNGILPPANAAGELHHPPAEFADRAVLEPPQRLRRSRLWRQHRPRAT